MAARVFTQQIQVPNDPGSALEVSTKQYADTKAAVVHSHAYSDITGVPDPVSTITDSSSVTPDANFGSSKVFMWTVALGNAVLNAPSNPDEGQIIRVCMKASGAIRTITLTGFIASTDYSTAAIAIPSGKWLTLSFQYIADIGWQIVGKVLQA
jgi:hypothetical protein